MALTSQSVLKGPSILSPNSVDERESLGCQKSGQPQDEWIYEEGGVGEWPGREASLREGGKRPISAPASGEATLGSVSAPGSSEQLNLQRPHSHIDDIYVLVKIPIGFFFFFYWIRTLALHSTS